LCFCFCYCILCNEKTLGWLHSVHFPLKSCRLCRHQCWAVLCIHGDERGNVLCSLLAWCVMYVESNMRGWCQELMKTPGGPSCRGMHVLGFKAFCSVGDPIAKCWIWSWGRWDVGHEKPLGVSYMGSRTKTWNLGWDYIPSKSTIQLSSRKLFAHYSSGS
jgi:hypothetical protein